MPTIASSAPPQRPPPGDADLQELYDQVLSAFADESSPSNFSPAFSLNVSNSVDRDDSLYSPHSDEGLASQIYSRTHPQTRRKSFAPLFPFIYLLISLSFSPSLHQSSRQQSLAPLPNILHYFPRGQGPSSPTKASWILPQHFLALPYPHARPPDRSRTPHSRLYRFQALSRTVRDSSDILYHFSCRVS
jgi:hypothetical protein